MDKFYETEHFRRLLEQYEEMRDKGTGCYLEADELTDIAEYYNMQGRTDEAMEAVELALRIFPGAAMPLAFKARMAMLVEGDLRKADELAEQIAVKTDIEYIYMKAEIMIAAGNAKEADAYFEDHLDSEEEGEDRENFVLDVANIFLDHEHYDLAGKWLDKVGDKDNTDYKELRAIMLMGNGKFKESEKLFNELIDSDPYSGEYWNSLARSQFMHNNISESITSSEYSIAINPKDEEAILNKANGLFSLGNYKEALKYYRKYTELVPGSEVGEMFQGITLSNLGNDDEAVAFLERAAKSAKRLNATNNMRQIYQELAIITSRMGDKEKALRYVKQMEKAGEDVVMADVIRGYIEMEHGDTANAQEHFVKAVRMAKGRPEVLMQVAIAIYDNGYPKIAYNIFHAAMKNVPDGWTFGYSHLARCCFDLGKRDEFEENLRKAIRLNPAEARSILGDLYPEGTHPEEYPDIEPVLPQR